MSSKNGNLYSVIKRPLVTEKTAVAGQGGDTIVFEVAKKANKAEIKNAVEKIFSVKVKSVRTLNFFGKTARVGMRQGKHSDWKKAYVSLSDGSAVNIIEGL